MQYYSSLINRCYLVYAILQPAFIRLFVGFDRAGRLYMIMALLIALFNFTCKDFWKEIRNRPVCIWCIWCIYAIISWLIIGKNSTDLEPYIFIFNKIINSFIVLYITCYEMRKDPENVSKTILVCFIIYMLIGVIFRGAEDIGGRGGQLLGNALPLNGVCLLAISSFCYQKEWCSWKIFILSVILCFYATLIVATRKALIGELLILVVVVYVKLNINRARDVLMLIMGCVFVYFVSVYVMDNTVIGERMSEIEDSGNRFNTTDYKILNFLGDRAYFYINGWRLFCEQPVFGIGLFNFRQTMRTHLPIHSEYIVQLCEMGIIGSILFINYYRSIFKRIRIVNSLGEKKIALIFLGWMAALLFVSLTTWTYEFPRYFLITGIFVGYSNWKEKEIYENNKENT